LNNGRQKIKRGQTFLTGKAINSEIIIDDIEVIVDNKGDSIFGEVTNIKRVTMKFYNYHSYIKITKVFISYSNHCPCIKF
jgi:predicted ATP-dependent serine protease